jgi:dephospho-CoA kinase
VPAIGITGGVATGKSSVARVLNLKLASHLPVFLFSADFEARRLTDSDLAVQEEIRSVFGGRVFNSDGTLARDRLRELVFRDASARNALEEILHPRIRQAWVAQLQGERLLLAEIPLLYETGAEGNFDLIIVTACSLQSQRLRLVAERRMPPALADQVIGSQLPLETKIQRADRLIWTDCPPSTTELQLNRVAQNIIDQYG